MADSNDKSPKLGVRGYLFVTALVVLIVHAAVGTLNYLVDPLWFFGGNKLQDRNFPFDERTARAAHFNASDKDFDCLIFGASRISVMNEHRFDGHKCFTISFANATPSELLAYAEYINERNTREPDLIIVGVDDFSYLGDVDMLDLPGPVAKDANPRFWNYYFSGDVARWSLRTLFDIAPKPRYYDDNLTGRIRADAGNLTVLESDEEPRQSLSRVVIQQYARFRELYPNAKLIAFATPVAAEQIWEYEQSGALRPYLEGLVLTAQHFDEMYDFSIPSHFTADPTLTYDGSHYRRDPVYDRIADALQRDDPDFGIVISGSNVEEIAAKYKDRLSLLGFNEFRGTRRASIGPWRNE